MLYELILINEIEQRAKIIFLSVGQCFRMQILHWIFHFIYLFMHLADAFIQSDLVHSGYSFFQYVCSLGIEPTTFALLTQCSTTEPQEQQYPVQCQFM